MKKNEKKQKILKSIVPNLNFYDTILMHLFKGYTCKIYRIGINDEFNWNQKELEYKSKR